MNKAKIKFFALLIAGLVVCAGLFLFLARLATVSKSSIAILVAPYDAKIMIDDKEYANGEYEIDAGDKKVVISGEGFETKELDINVSSWHTYRLNAVLRPENGNYSLYFRSKADFDILKNYEGDESVKDAVAKYEQKMTVADYLPYIDTRKNCDAESCYEDLKIEYVYDDADCFEFFCLKISTDSESVDFARESLAKFGYNLDDYSYKLERAE